MNDIKKEFYEKFNEASTPEYMWHWIEEKLKEKEEDEMKIFYRYVKRNHLVVFKGGEEIKKG